MKGRLRLAFWGTFALSQACRPGATLTPGAEAPSQTGATAAGEGAGSPAVSVAETRVREVRPEPRVTLTASDGTGLRLARLSARIVLDEPLAFTEMSLVFDNPQTRTLEGTFRFTVPPRASVSRFAMKVGEAWQEGEVVELQRARRSYEDFLHRKQDPALLEQSAGSEFTARVFPIPAGASKELVVSYSEEIAPGAPYQLPLRGLPELGGLDVTVSRAHGKEPLVALHRESVVPEDVIVPAVGGDGDGVAAGSLVLLRVRPEVTRAPEPLERALILVDTSASRALGMDRELAALAGIVAGVVEKSGPAAPVGVACFDQTVEAVYDGAAGKFGTNEIARIERRGALGASDLGRALDWARGAAKAHGYARVVLLTDGVATAGATKDDALVSRALALRGSGVDRLDAVALGGVRDDAALRRMVTAGLPHAGIVADVSDPSDAAALPERLSLATRSGVPVAVEGASWWWPKTLDGVMPGEERTVYAELADARRPPRVTIGTGTRAPKLRAVEPALMERAWAKAKIDSLLDRQAKAPADSTIVKQVVDLSVRHRVASPFTAMLVLETEADYARFHIDRRALSRILTVEGGVLVPMERDLFKRDAVTAGTGTARETRSGTAGAAAARDAEAEDNAERFGLVQLARRQASPMSRGGGEPADARGNMWGQAIGDSFGAGGLGLSGVGEGGGGEVREETAGGLDQGFGGGRGEGIGAGAVGTVGHGAGVGLGGVGIGGVGIGQGSAQSAVHVRAPMVRMGATTVSGRLPPEVIQRIVRQNFGRFRACYERGLVRAAGLTGRVAVRFVIDRSGEVSRADDGGSDLPDSEVVACVVHAFEGLAFPQPEGGIVTVVYPIVFSPEGGTGEAPLTLPVPRSAPREPARQEKFDARPDPYVGRFKSVMDALASGDVPSARRVAEDWHATAPGDVMALVALGEVYEASSDTERAARAYGSILDLFPARADMRRFAGGRLERLAGDGALDLAVDTYTKALEERPDHPSSHRALAYALLRKGDPEGAFKAIVDGLHYPYPGGRFLGVGRVMQEDAGLIGAAWMRAAPGRKAEIEKRVTDAGGVIEDTPSLRFVLSWETDANDVDLHVSDAQGGHAFYSRPRLPSGGMLYADVTTGYGPECFTVRGPAAGRAGPYKLEANYYARGPMGYGMGKVEVIDHDGAGNLRFEERPYVVMADQAFVDLGVVR